MGNCFKGCTQSASLSLPTRAPGQVVDLTATQDSAAGSVMLEWVAPTHNPDQVTSYDVRFKTVDAAHYTYLKPVDNVQELHVTLGQRDGLPPLTHCNFDVRARIHETAGQWCGVVQYVEWMCRLPDCSKSRLRFSHNHISAFCSRDHAKQCAMEYCLFQECQKSKTKQDGPLYHFCSPFHLRMAKLRNLSALLELNGPTNQFKELCKLFRKKWPKGTCPVVQSILQLVNPVVEERFTTYTNSLPRRNRKIEQFFHGTTLSCNILEHLVTCSGSQARDECMACGIVENGFEMRKIKGPWQRFGPGFYLASKSSKAGDYSRGQGNFRAIFLCDVAPGKKYELKTINPGLSAPPPDYHSVCGKSKFLGAIGDLNCDEIVLFSADAICPRYLFIFCIVAS